MSNPKDIYRLHVLKVDETSIQTATTGSTEWYCWLPKNENVVWLDEPVPGALARARVASWLMERHRQIVAGAWSTSSESE
jgi:hypothetical protein